MNVCDLFQKPKQYGAEAILAELLLRLRKTWRKVLRLFQFLSQIPNLDVETCGGFQLFQGENSPLFCISWQFRCIVGKCEFPNRQKDFTDALDLIFQGVSGKDDGKCFGVFVSSIGMC